MSSRNTQWNNLEQVGDGTWTYNEDNYTYNQVLSPVEGLAVKYNFVGYSTVWTNLDLL